MGTTDTPSPSIRITLSPDAPRASQDLSVGLVIRRTAAELRLTAGSAAVELVPGTPTRIPVTVSNVGQIDAANASVRFTRPSGATWAAPAVDDVPGRTCVGAGTTRPPAPTDRTIECSAPTLAGGVATVLTPGLESDGPVRGQLPVFSASVWPLVSTDGSTVDVAVRVSGSALEFAEAPAVVRHHGDDGFGNRRTVTFTVTNTGDDAARTSQAVVTLPAFLVAVPDANRGDRTGRCTASEDRHTVTCDLGTIQPGDTARRVRFGVRAVGSGAGDFVVALSAANGTGVVSTVRVAPWSDWPTPTPSPGG